MLAKIRKSRIYHFLLWLAIIACLYLLWQLSLQILNQPLRIIQQDFTHIWAAGHLNILGQNPYDPASILRLKNELAGLSVKQGIVSIFYSPPWTIPLAMSLAAFPYYLSRFLWLLINIILLVVSMRWIWEIYNGSQKQGWVPILVLLVFTPIYFVLQFGQLTIVILFGITGFIKQITGDHNDWLAGFFAALVSFKPQVFYLFWIALILWVIHYRRWKVLFGCLITLSIFSIIGIAFNNYLFSDYLYMVINFSPSPWLTPTIGGFLREIFGWEKFWLQFIPVIFGVTWLLFYWKQRHNLWRWHQEMPNLMFISLLTAIYAWTYDYSILLIAIIPAFGLLLMWEKRNLGLFVILVFVMLNIPYYLLHRSFTDEKFIWFLPALLFWYVIVTRFSPEGFKSDLGKRYNQ